MSQLADLGEECEVFHFAQPFDLILLRQYLYVGTSKASKLSTKNKQTEYLMPDFL